MADAGSAPWCVDVIARVDAPQDILQLIRMPHAFEDGELEALPPHPGARAFAMTQHDAWRKILSLRVRRLAGTPWR